MDTKSFQYCVQNGKYPIILEKGLYESINSVIPYPWIVILGVETVKGYRATNGHIVPQSYPDMCRIYDNNYGNIITIRDLVEKGFPRYAELQKSEEVRIVEHVGKDEYKVLPDKIKLKQGEVIEYVDKTKSSKTEYAQVRCSRMGKTTLLFPLKSEAKLKSYIDPNIYNIRTVFDSFKPDKNAIEIRYQGIDSYTLRFGDKAKVFVKLFAVLIPGSDRLYFIPVNEVEEHINNFSVIKSKDIEDLMKVSKAPKCTSNKIIEQFQDEDKIYTKLPVFVTKQTIAQQCDIKGLHTLIGEQIEKIRESGDPYNPTYDSEKSTDPASDSTYLLLNPEFKSLDRIIQNTEEAKKLRSNSQGQEVNDNIKRSRSGTLPNLPQQSDKPDYTMPDKRPNTLPRPKPTPAPRQNIPVIPEQRQNDSIVHHTTEVTQMFVKQMLQNGPLRDTHNIETIHDIPNDISTLSLNEVSKCFKVCGLEEAGEKAKKLGIDGKAFEELNPTVEDMKESFGVTTLQAKQFLRIIKGFRPPR